MAHTSHHGSSGANPDQDQLARLGYETRDIAINTLSRWLVGLFVFIAVATFGSLGLYKLFVPTYSEVERVSPLAHVRTYPPNPQLQARPKRDMIEYRSAEEKIESSYTKGENGTVNLPIDRAIDLLAERGISGIKGSQPVAPGSSMQQPASGDAPQDTTNYNSNPSGYKQGDPRPANTGGTQPGASTAPEMETPASARTENSSNAVPPAGGTAPTGR